MTYQIRWRHQYQRIADVLDQRRQQITPAPHACHKQWVNKDGKCWICAVVDAAPPLTPEQIDRLRSLLDPPRPAESVKPRRRKARA